MIKKDTVAILYPPGGYGTFVEWSMVYLMGHVPVDDRPFTASGSAHCYIGHGYDLQSSSPISGYFESDDHYPLVRTHGAMSPTFSFQNFVDAYSPYLNHVILMQPALDSTLMLTHNLITKVKSESNITKNQIDKLSSECEPLWSIRENLSFWFEGRYPHYNNWCAADGSNVIPVSIREFVDNPKHILLDIMGRTGFAASTERIDSYDTVINEWRPLQKFLDVDNVVMKIIDCTINNQHFDWSDQKLDLLDEAFIQMLLRSLHRLEIKCYNLDVFPTNTSDLRKLLINV